MELASFKEEGLSKNLYFLEKWVLSELNEAWKQLKEDEEVHMVLGGFMITHRMAMVIVMVRPVLIYEARTRRLDHRTRVRHGDVQATPLPAHLGLPFNFARNLYYRSSYSYAATHSIPGYVPPGYNALRTTLLQREKAHVDRLLKPIKDFWLENGVSIVSDEWSNPQRRPLINIMTVSDRGPVFIKAIDGSSEFKDKHYISGVLRDAIKEIAHDKVVQVINDNANVMKSVGALIEVADTRFASVVIMLKRLKLIKRCLQAMAISEQWASYREDDVGKAQKVKDMILSDFWWDSVDYIFEFTAPIYDMLQVADTDKHCLHFVYEMWDSMIEKVKAAIYWHEGLEDDEYSSFWGVVYDILIDRLNKNCTPLHYLAHSLNPKYYSIEWLSKNLKCIPSHWDHEISMEMSKFLDRYFEDVNELKVVKFEFAAFSGGRFPSSDVLTDR
ncbi:uncharacterized protein LOC142639469 [Castanea sativa]|uniref:uncharacterized protein LOC142639469 n=1 Tax=Castanea sativa TaxID=21020 RepID=UPI003F64E489